MGLCGNLYRTIYFTKKISFALIQIKLILPFSFLKAHRHYYKDVNKDNFPSNDDYLLEHIKRGMELGYTFKQCYEHWLKDFEIALYNTKIEVPEEEEEEVIYDYHEFQLILQEIMLLKVILLICCLCPHFLVESYPLPVTSFSLSSFSLSSVSVSSFPVKQWIGAEASDVSWVCLFYAL